MSENLSSYKLIEPDLPTFLLYITTIFFFGNFWWLLILFVYGKFCRLLEIFDKFSGFKKHTLFFLFSKKPLDKKGNNLFLTSFIFLFSYKKTIHFNKFSHFKKTDCHSFSKKLDRRNIALIFKWAWNLILIIYNYFSFLGCWFADKQLFFCCLTICRKYIVVNFQPLADTMQNKKQELYSVFKNKCC